MANVQYSHLLNEASTTRAINEILRALRRGELIKSFVARAKELEGIPGTHRCLGFDIFERGGSVSPYQWLLPKPTCDIADFINTYEQFADRPLGKFRNPGSAATGIYKGSAAGRKILTFLNDPGDWETAANILLAASLHLGGELEVHSPSLTRVRLGPALLEVTERGCWSNFRRAIHPAHMRGAEAPATVFQPVTTHNTYIRAFAEMSDDLDYGLRFAATAVALSIKAGVVDKGFLEDLVKGAASRESRAVGTGDLLKTCERILSGSSEGLLSALYECLVPRLMTSRTFRARFGVPSQVRSGRTFSSATRQAWLEQIANSYMGVTNAES